MFCSITVDGSDFTELVQMHLIRWIFLMMYSKVSHANDSDLGCNAKGAKVELIRNTAESCGSVQE